MSYTDPVQIETGSWEMKGSNISLIYFQVVPTLHLYS